MSEKRKSVIEIYAPTLGIKVDVPRNIMEPRSQPTGNNANLYYGINQKEFGTSLWNTGTATMTLPVTHLKELQYTNGRSLQAFTNTAMYKFSSTADVFVTDGQVYSGTYGDYWSGIQYNEAFIYTNGVNPIQYKASLSATGTNMASALTPSTLFAWHVEALGEHLCLYHVFDNATEYAKRIQWTKKGALTYSAATTDFASGTAGAIDLPDIEGEIKTAASVGGSIAVFADASIHVQDYVGGDEIYRFTKTVSGIGTPSRRGAVSHDNVVYFISDNNIYAYHGGDDLRLIGNPVKRSVYAEANMGALEHAWVEYDGIYNKVLFHIPTGTSTSPTATWVYAITDDSWIRLDRRYYSSTEFSRKDSITIGELAGNIGAQNFTFGSLEGIMQARIQLYGDGTGRVVKKDFTRYSVSSGGADLPQTYKYETPDLTGTPQKDSNGSKVAFTTTRQRWHQATIWACGEGTMLAEVSIDGGRTYSTLPQSPVTLVATGASHTLSIQKRAPQCSVRLSNTGTNETIGVEYINVEFIPGSENA